MASTVFSSTDLAIHSPSPSFGNPLGHEGGDSVRFYALLQACESVASVRAVARTWGLTEAVSASDAEWVLDVQNAVDRPLSHSQSGPRDLERGLLQVLIVNRLRQISALPDSRVFSVVDSLTGLPGVSAIEPSIEKRLRNYREKGSPFAVLFIDIDQFKKVNDLHGHRTGNRLLQALAGVLKTSFRDSDEVIRYGGDEFVVILDGVTSEQTWETAERTRRLIESHLFGVESLGENALRLTVSIGIAICPEDAASAAAVIEAADFAMYGAKREGANRSYRITREIGQVLTPHVN